jgi:ABC transport system ATP-binding/permease protein
VPVLVAQDLHKSFGPRCILDGVSLSIHSGERVGLVGLNGSGKSTLLSILAGLEPADSGQVATRRGAEVAFLEQDPKLDTDVSARSIVLSGLAAWSAAKARHDEISQSLARTSSGDEALLSAQAAAAAEVERFGGWNRMHQVDEILDHLGIRDPDAIMATLSGGDRRRVALAKILVARPVLAILDEPSNHLDAETIEWLEKYLIEEHTGALLLVTHDRYLLDRVVERTLELDRGKLYAYDGGYEAYLAAKAERLAHEVRVESNRQNFLRRELEWLRRQPKARTGKQKARIQRAEAAQSVVAPKAERTAEITAATTRSGKTILELKQLNLALGGRTLVNRLDFILAQGERVGVVGRNGTGKTTLLRAILGELPPAEGEVVLGKNTTVAYFDQQRSGLDEKKSIFDNVAAAATTISRDAETLDVRTHLERFLFDSFQQRQPVGSLSGGEKARVALAKMLANRSNLVILDEPTNDLDVATLGALEEMLIEYGGSAIVVTHDRWFLDRIATAILAFEEDGRVTRYAGNYGAYLTQKAAQEARPPAPAAASIKAKPSTAVPKKARGLTYAERIELESIVDQIDVAERAVAELEAHLADPALYASRGSEVAGIRRQLEEAQTAAARLIERWEQLEHKRGET